MTSLKQKAANRRNGLRSKGPKSEAGRARSSINARKHGLTSPIKGTVWSSNIEDVEVLLAEEGMSFAEVSEVARRIIEFERNLAYRRERFEAIAAPIEAVVPENAHELMNLAEGIANLRAQGRVAELGFDKPLAREIQMFFERMARWQIRQATQAATQELKNSDRYLRRAANQLIKQLRVLERD